MQEGARQQVFAGHLELLALGVLRPHGDALAAPHLLAKPGNAQAALLALLLAFHVHDLGVDEHELLCRVLAVRDSRSPRSCCATPICGAARPTPFGGIHRFEHVLQELVQLRRVELGDVVGLALQHRIAVLHNRINHNSEVLHLFQIAFVIAARLRQRIAAEFLQKRLRQHERHHRLADHARRRNHRHVATARRPPAPARASPDPPIRAAAAASRSASASRAPGCPAPLVMPPSRPPARLAPRVKRRAFAVVMDRVLHLRAEARRALRRESDLHALHRLHGDDRLRQAAVQPRIPGDVRAQADRHAARHHFEDAAHRVAGAVGLVHHFFHARFRRRIHAAEQHLVARGSARPVRPRRPARSSRTGPTAITWLSTSMPNSPSSALAIAPTATRAVVSRALARSRM